MGYSEVNGSITADNLAKSKLASPLKPLRADSEAFQIANFKEIKEAIYMKKNATFREGELAVSTKAGDVRVDRHVFAARTIHGSGLYSEFNKASLIKEAKDNLMSVKKDVPSEYSASVYFKKAFVHEIDQERPDGGATMSASLGTVFDAPEDGEDFTQANIDKMVKMAMETEGFEIALDFNTDQDGGDVVYTKELLDANGGKIRSILEAELSGTGLEFEGRNANDVLADYRGYVVERAVEASAKKHLSYTFSGEKLDEAVKHFMEHKFDENAEKVSYGDDKATLEGHDQGERAVNLMFREKGEGGGHHAHHASHSEHAAKRKYNSGNHTHQVWAEVRREDGGTQTIHNPAGKTSDVGNEIVVDLTRSKERLANLDKFTDDQNRERAFKVSFKEFVNNKFIDNNRISYRVDGDITTEYNKDLDCIDVRLNGHIVGVVDWPDAVEKIDPSRLRVAGIDENGKGIASVPKNINDREIANYVALCRKEAGITPITDAMEEAVRITTDCKNLYLASDMDYERYQEALKEAGIENRLDNLSLHLKVYTGLDMKDFMDGLKGQYINVAPGSISPLAVRGDDAIANEIAMTYTILGVDVDTENAFASLSKLYSKEVEVANLYEMTKDKEESFVGNLTKLASDPPSFNN